MNDKTTEAEKVAKAMAALDMIATVWAASFDIRLAVCSMKSLPDGDDRLIAFVKQAHCEGFYAGRTSLHVAQPEQEPIYQYQLSNGSWIDQAKQSHDYNVKHGQAVVRVLYASPKAAQTLQPAVSDADFKESVGLMLAAVGYTEAYAKQWPNEKVSVTFKRWFDEQIENEKLTQPEQPSKGLFIDMIAAHGTGFAAEIATSTEQPVQPKRPTNCGTNFCSCIECLFDSPLVQPTKYGAA